MDLKKLLMNIGILGLFVFSIITFIVITQGNNSVSNPITNNSIISTTYSDLNTTLGSSQRQAQTASDNFGNITPTQQYGELEVTSIVSPTRIAQTMILGLWNIYIKLPILILGVSPAVAELISTILVLFLIIGIWAVWKGVVA